MKNKYNVGLKGEAGAGFGSWQTGWAVRTNPFLMLSLSIVILESHFSAIKYVFLLSLSCIHGHPPPQFLSPALLYSSGRVVSAAVIIIITKNVFSYGVFVQVFVN